MCVCVCVCARVRARVLGGDSRGRAGYLGPGKEGLRLDTRGTIRKKEKEGLEVPKIKNLGSVKHPLKRTQGQRTHRGLGEQLGVGGGGWRVLLREKQNEETLPEVGSGPLGELGYNPFRWEVCHTAKGKEENQDS